MIQKKVHDASLKTPQQEVLSLTWEVSVSFMTSRIGGFSKTVFWRTHKWSQSLKCRVDF